MEHTSPPPSSVPLPAPCARLSHGSVRIRPNSPRISLTRGWQTWLVINTRDEPVPSIFIRFAQLTLGGNYVLRGYSGTNNTDFDGNRIIFFAVSERERENYIFFAFCRIVENVRIDVMRERPTLRLINTVWDKERKFILFVIWSIIK